jgi:hypothetical protein
MGLILSTEYRKVLTNLYTNLEKLPVLEIGERCNTETNLIDFIQPEECLYPIMSGTDRVGRPFIVVKGLAVLEDDSTVQFFQIFSKRYADLFTPFTVAQVILATPVTSVEWVGASNKHSQLMNCSEGMSIDQIDLLNKIIEKRIVPESDMLDNQERCYRFRFQQRVEMIKVDWN